MARSKEEQRRDDEAAAARESVGGEALRVDAPDRPDVSGVPADDLGSPGDAPQLTTKQLAQRGADADANRQPGSLGEFDASDRLEAVEPPPPPSDAPRLPAEAFDSPGFMVANAAARAAFDTVVLAPGHEFNFPGRYRNIDNLDDVYDVGPGMRIPDGLFLIPENYLLAEPERDRALKLGRR
jgi:hypothetical protein